MSAINNFGLKTIFSPFLLLIFLSCHKKQEKAPVIKNSNEITFISVSNIGGNLGNYRIIKITKDSISLEQGMTAKKTHQYWGSEITRKNWQQLTSTIDVKTLNKIKSSPSAQSVDGIDETFQIRTPRKSHVYVNSYHDTIHYQQLQKLKNRIQEILPKEYR
ncbi:hypothetical protein IQ37_08520 [Chryseobacterium piperi]|uniref:Uncharacterized protein n=1 Tax=Chryseobacterium piperi TaxID=558152 RepID=A0A086BIU9_9FLAO|nr:hypothetical protein [Chryseobacterium piperi]ASW76027.1 hypothetical protein CJF12_18300 [Chryseobacterium piperi]KFF28863.1 hypothetical protein IQ37_08520 [Chryseobacterium piperi]